MLKIKYLNNDKGVALITSIMLLSLLTIIGFSAMNSSDIELRIAGNERAATQAFNLAEAGIDHAFAKLSADKNFSTFENVNPEPYLQDVSLGSGNYNVLLTYYNVVPDDPNEPPDNFIKFTSHGSGGGNSVATIEVEIRSSEVVVNIPGAISCIGGFCIIDYDTGGGSPNDPNVSGLDHNPPGDFNCTGSACRQYEENGTGDAVPAIFLDADGEIFQGSNVVFWGEGEPPTSINTDTDNPTQASLDLSTLPGYDDIIPNDINNIGTRAAPKLSEISTSGARIERGAGILIIDGGEVDVDEDPIDLLIGGTSFFEGLIIIKNCGVLRANGTPHIYGAVRVDVPEEGCGPDYSPFAGNGRPAVMYSSEALANAFGALLATLNMTNWKQL